MSTTTCPVFRPSMEEFSNFSEYIKKIESIGADSHGICKVIPPEGWYHRDYNLHGELGQRIVSKPIRQFLSGKQGAFTIHIKEGKDISVLDFYRFCEKNKFECDSWLERERKFWRSLITEHNHPFYGSDVNDTLFGNNDACGWNVNALDTPMKDMTHVPGVSDSMLYYGSWRSMFGFHTEDFDLYSINYNHTGAAKSWYAIPPEKRQLFESTAAAYFASEHQKCKEYLRHKTHILSPPRLKEGGLPFVMAIQQAGEFIITFPGAYHAGFNHGFNIAEATNFVTEKWLNVGHKAKMCKCRPGLVQIDVIALETYILRDKKRKQLEMLKHVEDTVKESCDNSRCCSQITSTDSMTGLLRCSCGRSEFKGTDVLPLSAAMKCSEFIDNDIRVGQHSNSSSMNQKRPNIKYYSDAIKLGSLRQCGECDCWFHVTCLYDKNRMMPQHYPCHLCRQINGDTVHCKGIKSLPEINEKINGNDSKFEPVINSNVENEKGILINEQEAGLEAVVQDKCGDRDASPSPCKKQKSTSEVTVGDIVCATVVHDSARETVEVSGVVTDIYSGHFRLHVKGTRKESDHWIKLSDKNNYRVTQNAPRNGEMSLSCDRKAKRRSTRSEIVSTQSSRKKGHLRTMTSVGESEVDMPDVKKIKKTPSTNRNGRVTEGQCHGNNRSDVDRKDCSGSRCQTTRAGIEPSVNMAQAEKLVGVIAASHAIGLAHQKQLEAGNEDVETLDTGGVQDDFPQYIPQCKTLLALYRPVLNHELSRLYFQEDNIAVRKYIESFHSVFLSPESSPAQVMYDGFHCTFQTTLEIFYFNLQDITNSSYDLKTIRMFMQHMAQLIKLAGMENSVHMLVVEVSKLFHKFELSNR